MQIDAQLVRDLFTCCLKMQHELRFINDQTSALKKLQDPKMMAKCIENIKYMSDFAYKGAAGFPNVSKTLEYARAELQRQGEWWEWSIGFQKTKGDDHAN